MWLVASEKQLETPKQLSHHVCYVHWLYTYLLSMKMRENSPMLCINLNEKVVNVGFYAPVIRQT